MASLCLRTQIQRCTNICIAALISFVQYYTHNALVPVLINIFIFSLQYCYTIVLNSLYFSAVVVDKSNCGTIKLAYIFSQGLSNNLVSSCVREQHLPVPLRAGRS